LLAAGYAPAYGERPFDADEFAPVRAALERFLAAHEPYPAVVVDRQWNLVLANDALLRLIDGIAPVLIEPPANTLRATLHPDGLAARIVNFDEWSGHVIHRLGREIAVTGDPELQALLDELLTYPSVRAEPPPPGEAAAAEILLPLRIRHGGRTLALFGTLTTFGTAADVTLSELALEAFYPADDATAGALAGA
jgi:hypothetical protein